MTERPIGHACHGRNDQIVLELKGSDAHGSEKGRRILRRKGAIVIASSWAAKDAAAPLAARTEHHATDPKILDRRDVVDEREPCTACERERHRVVRKKRNETVGKGDSARAIP